MTILLWLLCAYLCTTAYSIVIIQKHQAMFNEFLGLFMDKKIDVDSDESEITNEEGSNIIKEMYVIAGKHGFSTFGFSVLIICFLINQPILIRYLNR